MTTTYSQRAPFNDWWYWSECLVKRFRTIAEIYKENGEIERSEQAVEWARKLKENCMVPVMAARKGMKTEEEKEKVRQLEEEAIFNAATMFRELLTNLPFISSAIQDFLFIDWRECKWEEPGENEDEFDEETGLQLKKKKKRVGDQRIIELFWGPRTRQDEGIRSGKVEDGGLPGILYNLLAAERSSSNRAPTEYGQVLQSAAAQQYIATNTQKWEQKIGMPLNLKPPGSI